MELPLGFILKGWDRLAQGWTARGKGGGPTLGSTNARATNSERVESHPAQFQRRYGSIGLLQTSQVWEQFFGGEAEDRPWHLPGDRVQGRPAEEKGWRSAARNGHRATVATGAIHAWARNGRGRGGGWQGVRFQSLAKSSRRSPRRIK